MTAHEVFLHDLTFFGVSMTFFDMSMTLCHVCQFFCLLKRNGPTLLNVFSFVKKKCCFMINTTNSYFAKSMSQQQVEWKRITITMQEARMRA